MRRGWVLWCVGFGYGEGLESIPVTVIDWWSLVQGVLGGRFALCGAFNS